MDDDIWRNIDSYANDRRELADIMAQNGPEAVLYAVFAALPLRNLLFRSTCLSCSFPSLQPRILTWKRWAESVHRGFLLKVRLRAL